MRELPPWRVRELGSTPYEEALAAMRRHVEGRLTSAPDELWVLEHPPVYTLGQAGRREHILDPGGIPVVQSDRGGQVTYHGPGQAVVYVLLDLRRRGLGVRALVRGLEEAVIGLLEGEGIPAHRRPGAPGVYVEGRKVAALGLRVRHGISYHGVSLNADLDLAPFRGIHPCGYEGLEVTRLADLGIDWDARETGRRLAARLPPCLDACAAGGGPGRSPRRCSPS